jgi:glycosyltransferase involved in cell wall biosynthesis
MDPKIFAVIPARNDAWILPRVLGSVSLWADRIIVVDESSWDETDEVCKQYPKVQLIKIEPKEFNESNRRQKLLEAVRQYDGQNLVFGLDSDEIITAEILNPQVRESFLSQIRPGMSAKLKWIMLWKNVHQYRYDETPEWSQSYKNFVYWDDRKMNFENVKMHSSRAPESTLANSITFPGFRVLHYAFADWDRMMAKHVYYLALEKTMGSKVHPYVLNRKYRWFYSEPKNGIILKNVPTEWVKPFEEHGVPMSNFSPQSLYWYEAEVLRFFEKFGAEYFKHLNIWDTDWDVKNRLAALAGEVGLPEGPIGNPQPWYDRFYYHYFQSFFDQGGTLDTLRRYIKK